MRTFALAALVASTQATDVTEVALIAEGLLEGFFNAQDFGDIAACIQDVEAVVTDAETAVSDLKQGGLENIVDGIKEIGQTVTDAKTALTDCKSITSSDWESIEAAAEQMKNPLSFAYHVGKDILVNGAQIYSDIETATSSWDSQDYKAFGVAAGDALEKVLVGEEIDTTEVYTYYGLSLSQVAQIVEGVLQGALSAESSDLVSCLGDAETVIGYLNTAFHDLEERTASGTAAGLVALGHALEEVEPIVSDCASITNEWSTIVNWAHTFTNPISFAMHVGEDILLNGTDIYNDIEDAITSWNSGSYEKFGEDVGDALAKVIVGMDDMYVIQ